MTPAVPGRYAVNDLADVARIPAPRRPGFFFVTYATVGYGHIVRSYRIARELAERAAVDAWIISCQPEFSFEEERPGVYRVDLPGAVLAHPEELPEAPPGPDRLAAPVPGMSLAGLSAHKSRLLLGLVRRLAPLGILIDNFPFSVVPGRAAAECAEALAYLRESVPGAIRAAGFRGVLAGSYGPREDRAAARLLERYVDLVLVYVEESEREEVLGRHPFLCGVESRTHFVGYVGPRPGAGPPGEAGPPARILAVFGGGLDAYRKIRLTCDAFLVFARDHPGHVLDVVTGGRLPEPGYREIEREYGRPETIRVRRFVPGLAQLLPRYDLVVSMGGYNACVELYQSATRSIVLPRISGADQEQLVEARKFQARGGIDRIVDSRVTSPAALAEVMATALAAPPAIRKPLDVAGAAATAALLAGELRRRAAAVRALGPVRAVTAPGDRPD